MMLPAGSTQQNPGELITMRQLRQGLDPMADAGWIVLIDTPPALWSAEAMTLAAVADATLLVTRVRNSRWSAMEHLAETLRRDGVRAIGVVLVGTRRNLSSLGIRDGYGYGTGHNDATAAAGPSWPRPQPGQDAIGRGNSAEPVGNGHRLEPRGNSSDHPSRLQPDQTLPSSSPPPRGRRRGRA